MTTGATGQLGLALPVQGELSGTWGDTVNNGITQYTNIAIAGTLTLTDDGAVTLANTTGDSSASNITSSLTGAGTVTAQFAIVKVTGTLTTAKVVTAPSYSKTYTVVNSATGGIVTFKASGQTGVSIAVGETAFVYFNGTDYVKVVGTATAGAAGGSNTQVQYNSSGVLAGSSSLTFDGTTFSAPNSVITSSSSSAALRITQTGSGDALLVEDSANPDSTPFVIDATGNIISGATTGVASQRFRIVGSLTGGTTAQGFNNSATIQSDVTSAAYIYASAPGTAAASFTLSALQHFRATQSTFGAGSAVTTQIGYAAESTLTGATYNYGFYGNIASGSNRYNLYMAGTADNYLGGSLGVGTTPTTGVSLILGKSLTGATNAYVVQALATVQSDVTGAAWGVLSQLNTAATAFTTQTRLFQASQGTIGAGSTLSSQTGFYADSSLTGATNNYGFYGAIASGTGRYNFYAAGTADNYMAGSLGIGAVPSAGQGVIVNKVVTGNADSVQVTARGAFQSDVTSSGIYYRTVGSTQATAFTLGEMTHFSAQQGTIGAGSTVTNQIGFNVSSSLTGATNNYGFYGGIASGTGRYNLYMAGTADNYLAGKLGLGTTTLTDTQLRIGSNMTGGSGYSTGVSYTGTIQSDVVTRADVFSSFPATQATAFTAANINHFFASSTTIGSGSTVTSQYGFHASSGLTGATNNYGFYGNLASGTGRWNFYAAGTAQNYFAGNVGIATTSPGSALDVKGTLRLSGSSSGYVGFAPAAAAGSTTYTLPSADGSSGQFLSTNGSGTLSWASGGGGGGSAATPTALGTVYGRTDSATPSATYVGYQAGNTSTATDNTAVGYSVLSSNTSGAYNVGVGGQRTGNSGATLLANTTGSYNTAVGISAMRENTTGSNNIAMGYSALFYNTTGGNNTAQGHQALQGNTTGLNNISVGYQSMYSNTTGTNNVAMGRQALYANSVGGENVAIGDNAMYANTASFNVAVGRLAMRFNTSGSENTALGYEALKANTTGNYNTAVGLDALFANTTASNNTAVGYQAGYSNTTGTRVTAIGYQAGYTTTTNSSSVYIGAFAGKYATGEANTAVGDNSQGNAATSASYNTSVGQGALANSVAANNTAVGYQALVNSTSATNNTVVGSTAGGAITTGVDNVIIGGQTANYSVSLTTGKDNVIIGAYSHTASASDNANIVIGRFTTGKGSTTGIINAGGGGIYQGNNSSTWSTTSDKRLKKNIVNNDVGLEKLTQIQVRNFEYRLPEEVDAELKPTDAINKTGVQLGVIAQELQAVLPECVKQESTGVLSVDTDNLTWYLINAVKQLKAEIDQLKGN